MSRAVSTVLDVGVAIVLVGASVAVLAGVPVPETGGQVDVHAAGGTAVAGSTVTVEYERVGGQTAAVTGTVAGLLADAARSRSAGVGDAYVSSVVAAAAERIDRTGTPTQLVGACRTHDRPQFVASTDDPVVAGPTPPTGEPVDATVYRWNDSDATEGAGDCEPVVVVRSWSP